MLIVDISRKSTEIKYKHTDKLTLWESMSINTKVFTNWVNHEKVLSL